MKMARGIWVGLVVLAVNLAHAGVYDDMMVAARNDDGEKVMALIQRGMDVNTADQNGTLAMYAARSGDQKLLEFLLNHRANILIKNSVGDDATLLAALKGHLECVKLLTNAGADINPPGAGWKPLNYAAFAGHLDITEYLIGKGAKIDARAPNGMTSLMLAARNGFPPIVRVLLENHADTDLKTPDGSTALDIARAANQAEIVELLSRPGAASGAH